MEEIYDYIDDGIFMVNEPSQWGGRWTEDKLDAFEKYVNAYLTIMNTHREKYGWKLLYYPTAIKIASQIISKKQGK